MIFTVGHSVHTLEAFIDLLQHHRIAQVADVRTYPMSRRHPHFNRDVLETRLANHGIAYRHFPSLGGLRKPQRNSVNTAWRHQGFRGYADHMQTAEFRTAVDDLLRSAGRARTAVMCAEAVWWRCHRRLLADALSVRGVAVRHILGLAPPKPHELSEFARPTSDGVIYPGLL